MNHLVIFDLEFTTWEGAHARGWSGENEHKEVTQIGALKVEWPSGKVLGELDILVKPKINPVVSEYFEKLTGITKEDIATRGVDFKDALESFRVFCGKELTGSYGNDCAVLTETALLQNVPANDLFNISFVNLHHYFRAFDHALNTNSGRLWQHFKLEKPTGADEHNALFDCYSILAALKHLHANGATLPL